MKVPGNKKKTVWRALSLAALLLTILSFTPLVIPPGRYHPSLFGMPYTLWTGLLGAILLVVFTWLGTKVFPFDDTQKGESVW